MGDYYPDRKWATEGDSPSFLYVYANGLNVPEEITFGGWGGRFSDTPVENIRGMKFIAQSGKDESLYDPYRMYACAAEGGNSIKRWKREIWNNFAARMAWTATDEYSAVNHHPVAIVDGHYGMNCIYKKVKAGRDMEFDASASYDPDGNPLAFRWEIYAEPSTYKGKVNMENGDSPKCRIHIPAEASGKSLHVILSLTDRGKPALTAYKRIVVQVL